MFLVSHSLFYTAILFPKTFILFLDNTSSVKVLTGLTQVEALVARQTLPPLGVCAAPILHSVDKQCHIFVPSLPYIG